MSAEYEKLQSLLKAVREKTDFVPDIAIVLGSGLEIALFCDIRIAAENAIFGLPETGLGIIPAAGGTQTLQRTIGLSRSLDMMLTVRQLNAAEALEAGLVSRVVPVGQLYGTAQAIAEKISSLSPAAVRNGKRAVLQGQDMTLSQGLELEKTLYSTLKYSGKRRDE